MTAFDPIEAARLVDVARSCIGCSGTGRFLGGECYRCMARLDGLLPSAACVIDKFADQLEAALAEVERMKRAFREQRDHDRKLIGELENYVDLKPSRETLSAEVERMRPVIAAVKTLAEKLDDGYQLLDEEIAAVADAYRAGKP